MPRPNSPKYLLRFDDICPTMNWEIWSQIEPLLVQAQVKPILAVVPDNQDSSLEAGPPAADFWDRVRAWQSRDWTIALHGYQHRYVSPHAGIAGLRKKSEFAGLSAEEQEEKLTSGLAIFDREGIKSRVWVAPGHSFDAVTVSLLPKFGIRIISDGYFRFPYRGGDNVIWVPQQLHRFRPSPAGVWTICFHHNHWSGADLHRFESDLEIHREDIWSLDDALAWYGNRRSSWSARRSTSPRLSSLMIRCQLKLWSLRHSRLRA